MAVLGCRSPLQVHNNNNNSYNITEYSVAIYLATAVILATMCFVVITCSLLANFSTDKVGLLWRRRIGVLIITGKNNFIPVFALPFRVTQFLSANQLNCAKLGEHINTHVNLTHTMGKTTLRVK